MLKLIAAALAPLMLAGCSAGMSYVMDEYTGVDVTPFAVEGDDTYRVFDKPQANKLMITPSMAKAAAIGSVRGLTFQAVDTSSPKAVLERVVSAYLESTGRKCRVTDGAPVLSVQWEFKYNCSAPVAVGAVPTTTGQRKR